MVLIHLFPYVTDPLKVIGGLTCVSNTKKEMIDVQNIVTQGRKQ